VLIIRGLVLIPVIQANIHALQISVRIEAQIHEQTKEINNLKKDCDDLKKRINFLERRLLEGDRRKQKRRQEDLGPPGESERRSGLDRRKDVRSPLNTAGLVLKSEE